MLSLSLKVLLILKIFQLTNCFPFAHELNLPSPDGNMDFLKTPPLKKAQTSVDDASELPLPTRHDQVDASTFFTDFPIAVSL